ncbi:MAG: NAD(P)/FAD-dependent oxidoreductase [Pseudomonadales bacterium]|nr:NAD(P)/FAD-dependent oxidoreductase [Pseudomonadales bacterium]MCP5184454.1 NAD(P)/FAD-dependent oxidoreductase [Pseudomonadales bacterium]
MHNLFPDLDFDPAALRARYRQERDKRIRPDGEAQYVEAAEQFADYADHDPYVDTLLEREPLDLELDVVVVGAGFSGLMTAARLKERGITNFRVIEAGADFGGTWYWNRYPGAQCDIESYCYLPLLEETGYMPREKYSFAPEIFAHTRRIGEYFGLYGNALFQTRVTELRWHESERRWQVSTHRGDNIRTRFVIQATGPANRPKLPGIPGIADFRGHAFHTSRWDYDYTGGDHNGALTKLADKRVAIIGTGATAIQCVPFLGEHAKQLYVFQRTPSSVDLRGNRQTDADWYATLGHGWQRARRENFAAVLAGQPVAEDLVADGWTDIARRIGISLMNRRADAGNLDMEELELRAEIADFQKMNEIRARVDAEVSEADAAEKLKPWYRQFCKRPTFNDAYLATFNRPNVQLIDVADAKGVERITENAVVANGVAYEVDCIIYATGFEITTQPHRRVDFDTIGCNGQSLYTHWKDGFRTLHGLSSHGFPNWFTIGINQNGLSPNMTAMFDDQAVHVSYVINEVLARGKTRMEVDAAAEEAWVRKIVAMAGTGATAFLEECTPGYYNREGKGAGTNRQNSPFAPGINAFNALLADWRQTGELAGLSLD